MRIKRSMSPKNALSQLDYFISFLWATEFDFIKMSSEYYFILFSILLIYIVPTPTFVCVAKETNKSFSERNEGKENEIPFDCCLW